MPEPYAFCINSRRWIAFMDASISYPKSCPYKGSCTTMGFRCDYFQEYQPTKYLLSKLKKINACKEGMMNVLSNKLLDAIIHKLAKKIADDLFTSGSGEKAIRLVLKLNDIDNAGGWCESAAIDRIEAILKSVI